MEIRMARAVWGELWLREGGRACPVGVGNPTIDPMWLGHGRTRKTLWRDAFHLVSFKMGGIQLQFLSVDVPPCGDT